MTPMKMSWHAEGDRFASEGSNQKQQSLQPSVDAVFIALIALRSKRTAIQPPPIIVIFTIREALLVLSRNHECLITARGYFSSPTAVLPNTWHPAAAKVKAGEAASHFSFFAVGVEGARMEILSQIAVREPLKLKELRFRDLFVWLSNSLGSVSKSAMGEKVDLENPATPSGWASV